tara:strand:- start:7867 stop:8565 length:699 start_codon:yes stop_codon:yes gene_type:complete
MEELLEGIDMGEIFQSKLLKNPDIAQLLEKVDHPETQNAFKNYFTGGSKWRKKHTRNRKKRGSGGTHSSTKKHQKDYAKRVDKSFKNFPFAMSSTTSEQDEYEHAYPLKSMSILGEKTRRGAMGDLMEDKDFRSLSHLDYLRTEAEDLKKEILKKEKKELSTATEENPAGKKVMYGGKWSLKYKRSINCRKPKGFSQKQYCKRKNRKSKKKRKKSRKKRKRRKKKRTRRKRR